MESRKTFLIDYTFEESDQTRKASLRVAAHTEEEARTLFLRSGPKRTNLIITKVTEKAK